MFDLTGQSALVTGASGGIGGAIARALHAQGPTVALAGTRRAALEALAAELGDRTHILAADLSQPDEPERLIREAEAALGQLDILVNNAGITRDGTMKRMDRGAWDAVMSYLTGSSLIPAPVDQNKMVTPDLLKDINKFDAASIK